MVIHFACFIMCIIDNIYNCLSIHDEWKKTYNEVNVSTSNYYFRKVSLHVTLKSVVTKSLTFKRSKHHLKHGLRVQEMNKTLRKIVPSEYGCKKTTIYNREQITFVCDLILAYIFLGWTTKSESRICILKKKSKYKSYTLFIFIQKQKSNSLDSYNLLIV